tara:strand:- start:19680 stop:20141 length:462 start_codon:yes stop_codon:yes gene_type:complete
MTVFTIGFTQQTASQFFEGLRAAGVQRVLDVRLNSTSQLAGFAKQADLRYFLKQLCNADYVPLLALAPTKPLLAAYRNGDMAWPAYEQAYLELLAKRRAEHEVDAGLLDGGCLLCSELEPHFCHRRLAVNYLQAVAGLDLTVQHIVKGKVVSV